MAHDIQTLGVISNDATWRAYIQFISNALTSGGLLKVTDSSQIDTATATQPGSNNTAAGYEIREFADALQSTAPIVFKIEYGRGSSANTLGIWITVGTGHDGSGNITDAFITRQSNSASSTASGHVSMIQVDDNGFRFAVCTHIETVNTTSNAFLLCSLERTKDENLDDTADGALLSMVSTPSNNQFTVYGEAATQQTYVERVGTCIVPYDQASGINSDLEVAVYPVYFWGSGRLLFPMSSFAHCFVSDLPMLTAIDCIVSGKTQKMIQIPKFNTSRQFLARDNSTAARIGLLMKWE